MWRSQNACTSRDSMFDLDKKPHSSGKYWSPKYTGCCVGECDILQSKYRYPLSMLRPDKLSLRRERDTPQYNIPTAPPLPYSKHTSPHFMAFDNPEKYFKAGYTGNRFFTYPQFGHTNMIDTHSALCDFTNGYQFTKSQEFAPLPFYHASLDGERPGSEIYPRNTGIIPSYKGHVPGMQYSYGRTFGAESINAKRYLDTDSICH